MANLLNPTFGTIGWLRISQLFANPFLGRKYNQDYFLRLFLYIFLTSHSSFLEEQRLYQARRVWARGNLMKEGFDCETNAEFIRCLRYKAVNPDFIGKT